MLDQDIREVRRIQEMLFEDEEGAVRQRQFRWKNAENGLGFSLDDPRKENADGEANAGSGDEENEHLWRKIRYEREQLLLENGLKGVTTCFTCKQLPELMKNVIFIKRKQQEAACLYPQLWLTPLCAS